MAIQAHLYTYPANSGFPSCGSQDLITDFSPQQNQQQLVSSLKHVQPLEQQHLQQLYNERQANQTMSVNPSLLLANSNAYSATNNYNSNHLSTPNPQSFAVEFENQRSEVDYFIRSQNERLRMMLQEERKQEAAALLKKVERDAVRMLREKDEEIAQAAVKRAELEELIGRVEADNEMWRRVAEEKEAMVLSLHKSLEQIQERNIGMEREDAESRCEEKRGREEGKGESREGEGGGGDRKRRSMMVCRNCKSGRSCMMLVPCRHLCSCKDCEPFLDACPVCRLPKKSAIETLLF